MWRLITIWQLASKDSCMFFFNDTATTEIYTLSLHDALPICASHDATMRTVERPTQPARHEQSPSGSAVPSTRSAARDRKSTRLNSSHANISYAVFCLKKNKHPQSIISNLLLYQHLKTILHSI